MDLKIRHELLLEIRRSNLGVLVGGHGNGPRHRLDSDSWCECLDHCATVINLEQRLGHSHHIHITHPVVPGALVDTLRLRFAAAALHTCGQRSGARLPRGNGQCLRLEAGVRKAFIAYPAASREAGVTRAGLALQRCCVHLGSQRILAGSKNVLTGDQLRAALVRGFIPLALARRAVLLARLVARGLHLTYPAVHRNQAALQEVRVHLALCQDAGGIVGTALAVVLAVLIVESAIVQFPCCAGVAGGRRVAHVLAFHVRAVALGCVIKNRLDLRDRCDGRGELLGGVPALPAAVVVELHAGCRAVAGHPVGLAREHLLHGLGKDRGQTAGPEVGLRRTRRDANCRFSTPIAIVRSMADLLRPRHPTHHLPLRAIVDCRVARALLHQPPHQLPVLACRDRAHASKKTGRSREGST
mmetsp:Transcript_62209/g.166618  ORF Transcript_62209/g.166618 Transcript_62209/m.166618 type:complete len:414 (-) Transcript_62209:444-1685(-)